LFNTMGQIYYFSENMKKFFYKKSHPLKGGFKNIIF